MDRRAFLCGSAALMAAGWRGARAAEAATLAADAEGGGAALRFAETVDRLEPIAPARRRWLAENPEGHAPAALNAMIPEIARVELDNTRAAAKAPARLRVIAWNIERGRAWADAARLIAEHPALRSPDVLLVSEMDIGMQRSGNEHTTRRFAEALGMNCAYGVEFVELARGEGETRANWERDNAWGYHGNAILARFPLRAVRMLRVGCAEKWYGRGEHRLGGRNAVFAEIDWQGAPLLLVSTHLESAITDRPVRVGEMEAIGREIAAQPAAMPVVFGGDLNDVPPSAPVQRLRDWGFELDSCNRLDVPTHVDERKGKVALLGPHIDYLAVRGARCVATEHTPAVVLAAYPPHRDGAVISDHGAVVADIERA